MNNTELIKRARSHILPWPQELCSELVLALEESERKLETIQDLVPIGIAQHDTMYDALMAINRVFWSND